ncbi:alpha-1,3-mannosyltransferase CMT1 [Stagonosporopsis vannaccii]|nr:alpha-1,3-mannosyltransferase CMT1 [Stagonosporopsis vannaccii]
MASLRSLRSLFKSVALLAAIFLLMLGFAFVQYSDRVLQTQPISTGKLDSPSDEEPGGEHIASSLTTTPTGLPRKANDTLIAQTPPYIQAILNTSDSRFALLECPQPDLDRYANLGHPSKQSEASQHPRFFFALDLHQCVHLLPRLLGSIVETITFLGPENCVLSIVEGRSSDGTFEVLEELRPSLQALGVKYLLQTSDIDPTAPGNDRIEALAGLRNLALHDLLTHPAHYDPDTTIIFLNDIALCMEDILELLHQRIRQGADQTCAMDWTYVGDNPTFYDVWIARGMTGDTFFRIPEDGSWDFAWNLFWNDDKARARLAAAQPFQVFACWNGVTSFTAKPLLDGRIKFRARGPGECFQGEPKLFAKDMWAKGYGKIAVVPSVNVEYGDEAARKIKALKGYVARHVADEGDGGRIEWETKPPEKVKCMPDYQHQTFVDWDEGLRPRVLGEDVR